MSNPTNIKIKVILFLCLWAFSRPAFSDQTITGEIININYDYKVAFTDISQVYLRPGDIVEVVHNGQLTTYLQVLETTSVVSKLGPVANTSLSGLKTDF